MAGVAGSGKSTVGAALADRLGARFIDGDSLHPTANVAKMSAGQPLDDHDRRPWLDAIVDAATTEPNVVIACSALARRYRDRLRQIHDVRFVFLELGQVAAEARTAARSDHFMSAAMVASQFDDLEQPGPEETDLIVVDASTDVTTIVAAAGLWLSSVDG